jgi:hypothetical protein
MPKKGPYSDARRGQHGAAKVIPNNPAPSVAQALKNSAKAVEQAKHK